MKRTAAVVDVVCVKMPKNNNFIKCFLNTNSISNENGFTTHNIDEASLKTRSSSMGIFPVDHSQFDKLLPSALRISQEPVS